MQKVKTKMRFTSLDIAAIITQLQSLIGLRVTNIYDVSPSTYLLKLAKSQQKSFLLIQNGIRFHIASQQLQHKAIPSGFTMKFRKYLRSKRLEKISQVGVQRVVVLTFGSEAFTNHLILQLYSQGNIILTDNNFKIIQCIRSHQFSQGVKTAVGEIYPFEHAAHIYMETLKYDQENVLSVMKDMEKGKQDQPEGQKKKKKKQKAQNKMKDIVFKIVPCLFPLAVEHILLTNNINPQQPVSAEKIQLVMKGIHISIDFLKNFLKSPQKGYIFSKTVDKQQPSRPGKTEQAMIEKKQQPQQKQTQKNYFQFSPFPNKKYTDSNVYICEQFKTFNETVQTYFEFLKKNPNTPNEAQDFQDIAWKKYDQIKKDQDERIQKLKEEQQQCKLKAQLIEKNVADIDVIIKIVKTMQDNGYSWQNIERMIYESKHNGDPYANMIYKVDIGKRQVLILLGDPTAQQQHFQLIPVQINIDYNAYTNATIYYESKKKTGQKEKRTKEASQQVLKLAQKDALKKIEKKKNQQMLKAVPIRKQFWFEKFYWFITTQGYLVISGRDSHQNQLLVKRYMKTGDLYMHSDYGGAASTVIKNPQRDQLVPRNSLEQAAIFTVCRSKAWQTKIISGAWWVQSDQVSKSAPTGQFLPTGSFMIRGKRNFVYPNKMQMGMTLLYKINQESIQKYINQKKILEQELQTKIQQKSTGLQQQFAIVSYQTNVASKKPFQKGKNNQKQQAIPKNNLAKTQSNKQVQQQINDSDQNSDDDSKSQDDFELKKKNDKKNQPKKGTEKKNKPQQQNEPKKRVNKKKLKKLQKYLEQQDEEQRQMIMKMIGAKEMKHMKEDADEPEEEEKKKGGKGKNKNKNKKGINKYIGQSEEETQKKLDPEKILFLQQKQKNESKQDKNKITDKNLNNKQTKEIKEQTKAQRKIVKQKETQEKVQDKKQEQPKIQKQTQKAQTQQTNQNQEPKQESNQENKQEPNQETKQEPKQQDISEDSSSQKEQEEKEQPQQKQQPQQQQVDQKIIDSELAQLNKLVGKIHVNDSFQCLVPMCAPYPTIAENRFKIKLVPGGLKKGKAARNIIHYFSQLGDLNQAQKPYVKGMPEQQLINSLLSSVKLTGAGLLKIQMKQKAEKKQKRKENDKKK